MPTNSNTISYHSQQKLSLSKMSCAKPLSVCKTKNSNVEVHNSTHTIQGNYTKENDILFSLSITTIMLRQLINYVNSLRKIKVTCMTNEFRHSTIWEYSPHDYTLWPHVKLLCLISIHFKIVCLLIHPDVVHSLTLLWFLFTRKLAIQFVLSIVQRQRTHRKLYIYVSI